jgi:hypothetical protein
VNDDENTTLGRMDERLKAVQQSVNRIETTFVMLSRYLPVERLVFGLVALVLSATFVAIIALVLRR